MRQLIDPSFVCEIRDINSRLWSLNTVDFEERLRAWTLSINERLVRLRGDLTVPPDCSIIIPACNEEKYLLMLLESLARQKSRYSAEIIIVDSNSSKTDRTSKIARLQVPS